MDTGQEKLEPLEKMRSRRNWENIQIMQFVDVFFHRHIMLDVFVCLLDVQRSKWEAG